MESKDVQTQLSSDPEALGHRLFSVGHSDQELHQLITLLRKAGVTAVADVRSVPYSRRLSQFNKAGLENALREQDIAYIYLGHELGGRPRSRDLYDGDGRVNYECVRQTALFRRGLERLLGELDRHVLAMLCGEDDPLDCHRGLMITPALIEQGVRPRHLRKDGFIETTPEMEARLLKETKQARHLEGSLFPPTPEEIREVYAEAYRLMAKKKAFRLDSDDPGLTGEEN
jgi:uncharacterized protein (DUF488 family)